MEWGGGHEAEVQVPLYFPIPPILLSPATRPEVITVTSPSLLISLYMADNQVRN